MPYYTKGSLFDFLHNENNNNNKLTSKQKINISIGIIKGIEYLHKHNIIHYHLTSKNILIDDNLNPIIADYGFNNLKKTYNIFNKYHNLNSYSSPEMLTETSGKLCGSLSNNFNEKNDIYSFGLILWELFTETIPFNVKLKDVKNYVLNEKLRPEIKDDIDKEIANLIRECWDTEPANRPECESILNLFIKKYKEIDN
jgi:serine/threonine protein kinase